MVFGDRSLFGGVVTATIFAVVALGIIIFKIDPFEIGGLEKAVFFVAFFIALWGVLSFVFLSIRRLWSKRITFNEVFRSSFWWGLLTTILIFGLFFGRRYL